MKKRNADGDIVPGTLPVDPLRPSHPNNLQSGRRMNSVYLELHNPNSPDTDGWFNDDAGHNFPWYTSLPERNFVRFTYNTLNRTCRTSMKFYCLVVFGSQAKVVKDYTHSNEVNCELDKGPYQDLVDLLLELSNG